MTFLVTFIFVGHGFKNLTVWSPGVNLDPGSYKLYDLSQSHCTSVFLSVK